MLPKVHLGKRQNRISRKPVRAKRIFHPRTLGGLKVKGDGKVLRALQVAFGWCFALCFLPVGVTCGTRVTRGTFDFQEENACELRA